MKILYAGDSPAGGPANYLLGILRFIKADFIHIPPSKTLKPGLLKKNFDAIILSDFSRKRVPAISQELIAKKVNGGMGLLMIGGWGSFSGPFGKWHGSLIEKILPVSCLNRDDRINFPGGAWIVQKRKHASLRDASFKNPPVICGLNKVIPKKNSEVLLCAKKIPPPNLSSSYAAEYPLLLIDRDPRKRIAALTTDLAPHWCGGLVDWGSRRLKLPVKGNISVEVGNLYVRFISSLLTWLYSA